MILFHLYTKTIDSELTQSHLCTQLQATIHSETQE